MRRRACDVRCRGQHRVPHRGAGRRPHRAHRGLGRGRAVLGAGHHHPRVCVRRADRGALAQRSRLQPARGLRGSRVRLRARDALVQHRRAAEPAGRGLRRGRRAPHRRLGRGGRAVHRDLHQPPGVRERTDGLLLQEPRGDLRLGAARAARGRHGDAARPRLPRRRHLGGDRAARGARGRAHEPALPHALSDEPRARDALLRRVPLSALPAADRGVARRGRGRVTRGGSPAARRLPLLPRDPRARRGALGTLDDAGRRLPRARVVPGVRTRVRRVRAR